MLQGALPADGRAGARPPVPARPPPAGAASMLRSGRLDIGAGEVLALEQQRLTGRARQRVGEAVAEVERRRMVALPEAPPGAPGLLCMFGQDRFRIDPRLSRKASHSCPAAVPPRLSTTMNTSSRWQPTCGNSVPRRAPSRNAPHPPRGTGRPAEPSCRRSSGQSAFVVEQIAVLGGGGARPQQPGTALGDGAQLSLAGLGAALPLLPLQTFAQRHGDRPGLGLAGQSSELAGQPAGLVVLDVQALPIPPRGRIRKPILP